MYHFLSDITDYNFFSYYLGLIKPLHLLLVNNEDNRNELSSVIAIDSLTNNIYHLSSPFDGGVIKPLVSPKKKLLLCYVNDDYRSKISFLSIIKITSRGNKNTYTDYIGYNATQWQIEDAVWINENSFALKVYDMVLETLANNRVEERHQNIRYFEVVVSDK